MIEDRLGLAMLIRKIAAQAKTRSAALAETESDQPTLARENLHRQLTAIFARHCAFRALDDRRAEAAIILELLCAVLNGDPRFPAGELVIGALISVLEPAPAAHVIDQDRL